MAINEEKREPRETSSLAELQSIVQSIHIHLRTRDPFEIAVKMGAMIVYKPMPLECSFQHLKVRDSFVIALNSSYSSSVFPNLVAQAIAHFLLHGVGEMNEQQKAEAREFASLLLPVDSPAV